MLRIVGLPRSSYYYHLCYRRERKAFGGRPAPGYSRDHLGNYISDDVIKQQIQQIIENEGFGYGYIKITVLLRRRAGLQISRKKVYRLLKEMNLLKPQRRRNRNIVPRKLSKRRDVTGPNQLWEIDIKYGYIFGEGRFFFISTVLDVYDRVAVDYHIGLSCTGKDIADALARALHKRSPSTMPAVRTDNGPQFTSAAFELFCLENGIEHERIPIETPNGIAHIEAFHSILEEDCLGLFEFENYEEAYREVMEFMFYYNNVRIHSAIGYQAPMEYHEKIMSNSQRTLKMCA